MRIIFLNIDDSERVCVSVCLLRVLSMCAQCKFMRWNVSFGWIEFRKVLMEFKWFTQESPISTWHPKKRQNGTTRKNEPTKQLMCIVRSHYIINCHITITTNMEISHLKLKLVGCFSPYLPQQKMKISFCSQSKTTQSTSTALGAAQKKY